MNLVSVITAVDGDLGGLARLTRSLIDQSYPYWEMVIVSDDSRCYRSELQQRGISDPRLRFLWTQRPGSGLDLAQQLGMLHARGNFLAPLDTNSVCHPERLDRLLPMALEYGICGNNLVRRDSTTGAIADSLFPPGDGVRWLPMDGDELPMDVVVNRELVDCGSRRRIQYHGRATAGSPTASVPRRVPVIEAVLQERHAVFSIRRPPPTRLCA